MQLSQTLFQLEQGTEYLRLETVGRRSGNPHSVLVRFVVIEGRIIVFPQNVGRQDWILNLASNPRVKLFKDSRSFSATAQLRTITRLDDPILKIFTRKYGTQIVRQRYWGQKRYAVLQITDSQAMAIHQLVYDDLETAFDGVADDYDRHIFGNPINTWLRNISVMVLKQHFRPGDTVLELGCGTGTETLSLARQGTMVLACDISGKMLKVLEKKAELEGLRDRVVTIHCRPSELRYRVQSLGFQKIDGAYSTYGAINTEPRLDDLFRDIHCLLKPGKPLILGVWNRYCLYEMAGYILRGRPRLAFARLRNPVPIGKSRFCVSSNAYTVTSLRRHLGSQFDLQSVYGVVILLPPSNLTRYLPGDRLLGFLKGVDIRLGRTFPFNRLGDHFLAVYYNKM